MLNVVLSRRVVRLEPPQQLLLLEVTRRSDGFSFKIVPADAVETSEVRLVSRSLVSEHRSEADAVQAVAAAAIAGFTLIGELDISEIPEGY
jgi:hypothetical protein